MPKPSETQSFEEQDQHDLSRQAGQPLFMTFEEFHEWVDEDTLAELIDGVVVMTSPASLRHQDIINFLIALLSTFTRIHSLGKVTDGPFPMRLGKKDGPEPDLLYVAREHLHRLKLTYLDGPADLVVEVVSPESVERDRSTKFGKYQDAGILEYWLVDPMRPEARFYQLDAAGQYQTVAPDTNGIYRSQALPGFWLRVTWLWQDLLPDPTQTLLEIDRDAYGQYLREQLRQAGL